MQIHVQTFMALPGNQSGLIYRVCYKQIKDIAGLTPGARTKTKTSVQVHIINFTPISLDPPTPTVTPKQVIITGQQKSATLTCVANGNRIRSVAWFKGKGLICSFKFNASRSQSIVHENQAVLFDKSLLYFQELARIKPQIKLSH